MRHGLYWLGIIGALLGGVALALWLLVAGPEWVCYDGGGCMSAPGWCLWVYAAIAFGPAIVVLLMWLRAWGIQRRSARALPG